MINKGAKAFTGLFYSFFMFLEIILLLVGEGIMFGNRVFDNEIRLFALAGIVVSSMGIVLIFKDKNIGYLIISVTIVITLVIYFGHRMLWWPCEYCRM